MLAAMQTHQLKTRQTMKTKLLFTIGLMLQFIVATAQLNINVSETYNTPCDTCVLLTVSVSGGTAPYNFQWTLNNQPYSSEQNLNYCDKNPFQFWDSLRLVVTDVNSQQGIYGNAIGYLLSTNLPIGYQLCIVTVDTATGKNLLVWEQTDNPSAVSYNIYKQNTSSVFEVIASLPLSSYSTFIDTLSNPTQVSSMYHISVVDECGFESSLITNGPPLNTIHLTISAGIAPAWNLNWNWTQGYTINKYRIWRATTPNNPVLIDSVANTVFAYTDLTPPLGVLYYTIEAISDVLCNPSFKTSQINSLYNSAFSNVADNISANINENTTKQTIKISPNPFASQTTLQTDKTLANATLALYNSLGQQVKQIVNISGQTVTLHRDNLSSGLYYLQLTQDNQTIASDKLVITD